MKTDLKFVYYPNNRVKRAHFLDSTNKDTGHLGPQSQEKLLSLRGDIATNKLYNSQNTRKYNCSRASFLALNVNLCLTTKQKNENSSF